LAKLGLATFSAGTWASYGTLDGFVPKPYDNGLELYSFHKPLVAGLYGQILGQPAFLSVPWLWTAKRETGETRHRTALGDGEFYLGRKAGRWEGRLGMVLPLGYDRDNGDPWIGPGNLQVTAGAAANPNFSRYSRKWEGSAEVKFSLALDDAIAKAGSWGLYPGAKLSYRPSGAWKLGLEGIGYWKSSYWGRSATLNQSLFGGNGPKAQWNAGLVPILFGEWFARPGFAYGLKAGHSLWGYRDAASYTASAYMLIFP
jgi:hypothetical protein